MPEGKGYKKKAGTHTRNEPMNKKEKRQPKTRKVTVVTQRKPSGGKGGS